MNYTKPFTTFSDQTNKLLEDRGILFNEITKQEAEEKLAHINYYKLSAYTKYFEDPNIKNTFPNIEFSKIIDLYYFDKKLRGLLFSAIEEIEISIKTSLSHYISEHTKSEGALGYTKIKTWIELQKNIKIINYKKIQAKKKINLSLKEILSIELDLKSRWNSFIDKNKDKYAEHYFKNYSKEHFIPLWMLVNDIDFGAAVRLYELSCDSIKQKISSVYGVNNDDMIHYLRAIKLLRNFCAHNSRVWNVGFGHDIKWKTKRPKKINSSKTIARILLLRHFMKKVNPSNDFSEIKSCLLEHFKKYPKQIKDIGVLDGKLATLESLL
ncbi:MAG: Abi family protein [Fusobacteriaceae bacterium]